MYRTAAIAMLLVSACASSNDGEGGNGSIDASFVDGQPAADADTTAPYRHTITVDGVSDFSSGELFDTTSSGYQAAFTWDDDNLYLGYLGADIAVDASDSASKWVMVYIDTDPGGDAGSATGETYNTQTPTFPAGFLADYYFRRKSDGTLDELKSWDDPGWSVAVDIDAVVQGSTMEAAVALTALGDPANISIVAFMINEKPTVEWSYAGLYADSFTDGYAETLAIGHYLNVSLSASTPPNAAGNKR